MWSVCGRGWPARWVLVRPRRQWEVGRPWFGEFVNYDEDLATAISLLCLTTTEEPRPERPAQGGLCEVPSTPANAKPPVRRDE